MRQHLDDHDCENSMLAALCLSDYLENAACGQALLVVTSEPMLQPHAIDHRVQSKSLSRHGGYFFVCPIASTGQPGDLRRKLL